MSDPDAATVGVRAAALVAHEAAAGFVEHSVAAMAVAVAELHPRLCTFLVRKRMLLQSLPPMAAQ